jgi:hypothetical protein
LDWYLVLFGASVGGMGAGLLWTAQGTYFKYNAMKYAQACRDEDLAKLFHEGIVDNEAKDDDVVANISNQPMKKPMTDEGASSLFSSLFASWYLGLEVLMSLVGSLVARYCSDSSLYTVYALYSVTCVVASVGMTKIMDMDPHVVTSSSSFTTNFNDMSNVDNKNVNNRVINNSAINNNNNNNNNNNIKRVESGHFKKTSSLNEPLLSGSKTLAPLNTSVVVVSDTLHTIATTPHEAEKPFAFINDGCVICQATAPVVSTPNKSAMMSPRLPNTPNTPTTTMNTPRSNYLLRSDSSFSRRSQSKNQTSFELVTSALHLLFNNPKCYLMVPTNLAFGFTSVFLTAYVGGT